MIVKIDRSSIKKNPTAGRTSFTTVGPWELTGTVNGEIPDNLKDHLIVQSQEAVNGMVTKTDFIVIENHQEVLQMLIDARIPHNLEREAQTHHTIHPDPDYLYEYEDPLIKCGNCQNESNVSEVEDYDDDGNYITACPICLITDSFESIEYEKIEDVLREEPEIR